jgi:hypothetical protein
MNDFSEIENELKKLRPAQASRELFVRIEQRLAGPEISDHRIIRPNRFRVKSVAIGFGLAAAALLIVLAQISIRQLPDTPKQGESISQISPVPETRPVLTGPEGSISSSEFVPAGATQVVYNTRNEGLQVPGGSEQPLRRLRYQMQQTWQWRNPATGASLRVSYPSDEIVLIPISGQ